MASTNQAARSHYEKLLAPVYGWMIGDLESAQSRAREEVAHIGPFPAGAMAVDLGGGLGLHARALADAGHESVWLFDTSTDLLHSARERTRGHGVHAVAVDLTDFDTHVPLPVDTILCMGDTLTHLADSDEVQALLEVVAGSLRPGGVFLTTFRDYSVELQGPDRFLLVRGDHERILTVFLEYGGEAVTVHDMLHARHGKEWSLQVGSYPKLRLDPSWVTSSLRDCGLSVETGTTFGGLTRIVARPT